MIDVGFIGLGQMGAPMAKNIMRAGFRLFVYDINKSRVESMAREGALPCSSPRDVAERSGVIITMLPDDEAVRDVVRGVAEGARSGCVLVEMSTISLRALNEVVNVMRSVGCDVVDAPVSGNPGWAREGRLVIYVSGDPDTINRVMPILNALGRVYVVGGLGKGKALKYVNNLLVAVNKLAALEALALAERVGLDLRVLYEAIRESGGSSRMFEEHVASVLNGDEEGLVRRSWNSKDLRLIMELANELGVPLYLASTSLQLIQSAINEFGEENLRSLLKFYRKHAGLPVDH